MSLCRLECLGLDTEEIATVQSYIVTQMPPYTKPAVVVSWYLFIYEAVVTEISCFYREKRHQVLKSYHLPILVEDPFFHWQKYVFESASVHAKGFFSIEKPHCFSCTYSKDESK